MMPSKYTHPKVPNKQSTTTVSLSQQKISVSPIPPAEELEAYDRIFPGAAERIFNGFDEERKHRHQRENKEVDTISYIEKKKVRIVGRGQIFAFIIGLIILLLAIFLIVAKEKIGEGCWIIGGLLGTAIISGLLNNVFNKEDKKEAK